MTRRFPYLLMASLLCACSINPITTPARSASEELLISSASERAAEALAQALPNGESVYIDATYFDVPDGKYAIGTIRAAIAKHGTHIETDRTKADNVVEIRAGALSVDKHKFLLGIPEFSLPFPLAGAVSVPEIALYSLNEEQGVAKFAATLWKRSDGSLVSAPDPQFGYSHRRKRTVLLFISWHSQDFVATQDKDPEEN